MESPESITASPKPSSASSAPASPASAPAPDLSSLSSKLKAHWKGGSAAVEPKPEAVRAGQIRKFRITKLDPSAKKIDLELA